MNISDLLKNFTQQKPKGIGDVIAIATQAVGIKPCGSCNQRKEKLNQLIPFNTNQNEK